jgi:hypothetical protein
MKVDLHTLIRQLGVNRILPMRAANVCDFNEVSTVNDLLSFYRAGKDFQKFRNCGLKTRMELEEFCSRYAYLTENDNVASESEDDYEFLNPAIDYENITVHELSKRHKWSVRSLNCCVISDISNLNDLIDVYRHSESFIRLKNCGQKTNRELIDTVEFYVNDLRSYSEELSVVFDQNPSISELASKHHWSVRTVNCCNSEGVVDLEGIARYYETYGSFLAWKKCGAKTNEELIETVNYYRKVRRVSKNYASLLSDFLGFPELLSIEIEQTECYKEFGKSLKRVLWDLKLFNLRDVFNYSSVDKDNAVNVESNAIDFIAMLRNQYSVAFGLYARLSTWLDMEEIYERTERNSELLESLNSLLRLKNFDLCGLEQLKKNFTEWDEKSIVQIIVILLADIRFRTDYGIYLNSYLDSVCPLNIKLFSFLNVYFRYRRDKSELQNEIINSLLLECKRELTLRDLGSQFHLSPERIRQIRTREFDLLKRDLCVLDFIVNSKLKIFDYVKSGSNVDICREFCDKLNALEKTNFSRNFIVLALSIIYKNSHTLIVLDRFDVLQLSHQEILSSRDSLRFILIDSSYFDLICIKDLMKDLKRRKSESKSSNRNIDLRKFVQLHITCSEENCFDFIDLAKSLIQGLEGLQISSDNVLLFAGNSVRKIQNLTCGIFKEHNVPLTINDLLLELKNKLPTINLSKDYIRRSLGDKDVFVSYGLSGYYGLKEWDEAIDLSKAELIVDLVKKYLKDCLLPQHISLIYDFIRRVRATSDRTVETMIRLDQSGDIIKYGGGYYGLRSIHPQEKEFFVRPLIGSHFRDKVLKRYHLSDFERVVSDLARKNNYFLDQVRAALIARCENGKFEINHDGKFVVKSELLEKGEDVNVHSKHISRDYRDSTLFQISDPEILEVVVPLLKEDRYVKAIEEASKYYGRRGVKLSFMQWKELIESLRC